MADEEKKERISVAIGTGMVAVALIFDAAQVFLAFTIVGYAILWIVSLQAFLIFTLWLGMNGALGLGRAGILATVMAGGCIGIPAWTATVWPMVARTIAADKLDAVVPGAGAIVNKIKI